jgi:hexosaminidase
VTDSHLDTTWDAMYNNEPTDGLSPTSDPSLILGGESCMWGETVDPSDLDQTIWPRAAAVAERLWSSKDSIQSLEEAEGRLQTFRCLLTQRGIAAAPVLNKYARSPPPNPASCYSQRRGRRV